MASPFLRLLLFMLFSGCVFGEVLFSSLPRTLFVRTSFETRSVLMAGEDSISVRWGLNASTQSGVDSQYKKVKVELCYAPISQEDRAWRKTNNDLSRDKTCQHEIVVRPYTGSNREDSIDWKIKRDVPTATYFVRAYAIDADGNQVGYGQSTDSHKTTNLFTVEGISGRHQSLDIAAGCFSAAAVVMLFAFFFAEKRSAKKSQGK